jgi:hypothetical protein
MRFAIATLSLVVAASAAACQKGDPAGSGGEGRAPELAASGGKPVPEGFVTRFTAPDGQEVELAYSQMWVALHEGKMAIKLSAVAGAAPDRALDIYVDLSNRKPHRIEDLEGAWLTPFPPAADGFVYQPRAGDRSSRRRARSAAMTIERVGEDAIEGTFTADFGGGEVIADGSFRAARSPNLEPASLAAVAERSR